MTFSLCRDRFLLSDAREEEALARGENDHLADRKERSVLLVLKALFTRCIHTSYRRKERVYWYERSPLCLPAMRVDGVGICPLRAIAGEGQLFLLLQIREPSE